MAIGLTVLTVLALAGLLVFDHREDAPKRLVFKTLASAAFVALALSGWTSPARPFVLFVYVGLVLCAVGDVALALPAKTERLFVVALVAFLLGHLAFLGAAIFRAAPAEWITPWALLPLASTTAAFLWLRPHLGAMMGPVAAYNVAITAMVIGAIALVRTDASAWPFTVGAVLFYASDLSVARDKFVAKGFVNRAWGLPAYYFGQIFVAWSTLR